MRSIISVILAVLVLWLITPILSCIAKVLVLLAVTYFMYIFCYPWIKKNFFKH